MGLLTWIVFGALAGWIASIIMKRNSEMGWVSNIITGIVGSVLGGFVASLFGLGTVSGFNIYSMLIAIGGACLVLLIIGGFKNAATK